MGKVIIAGSALIEGLMMIGRSNAAIAIRKPEGDIHLEKRCYTRSGQVYKIPIIRGVFSFIWQMILVTKAMMFSASFFDLEEEGNESGIDRFLDKLFGEKLKDVIVYFSLSLSLAFSIGLFILLPNLLAGLLKLDNSTYMGVIYYNLFEGVLRISLFIGYLTIASRAKDIKRVWEYHGAEHKTINCYEHGEELTVDNVMKHSAKNPRCGTSYMFFVLLVSILFFSFIGWYSIWMNIIIRLMLIPFVAGLSFELFILAGKGDSKLAEIICIPGMLLQRLTTKEPDKQQIEVAIEAFNAVLLVEEENSINKCAAL
ncbi:MAG TPA: DUF1385 domain-containing protein [Clostridia bacterium]|nr:DUF1385 domain-containing protein [Clostridia bacterium]